MSIVWLSFKIEIGAEWLITISDLNFDLTIAIYIMYFCLFNIFDINFAEFDCSKRRQWDWGGYSEINLVFKKQYLFNIL